MRPYSEQHRCSGTRTSKLRRRWSVIRASVRRQVKKRARTTGALLAVVLIGCASGAQTWPQVVDNHVLISAGVVCWALLCVGWLIRGPVRVHIEAKQKDNKEVQTPDDDTARVVAANVKRAIDGVPPRTKPKPPGLEYTREGFDPVERP